MTHPSLSDEVKRILAVMAQFVDAPKGVPGPFIHRPTHTAVSDAAMQARRLLGAYETGPANQLDVVGADGRPLRVTQAATPLLPDSLGHLLLNLVNHADVGPAPLATYQERLPGCHPGNTHRALDGLVACGLLRLQGECYHLTVAGQAELSRLGPLPLGGEGP